MGNYKNLEPEFIERTIALIEQYSEICTQFPFEQQYNYTLTINCLLGLIVLPKERVVSYIPKKRLTNDLFEEIGLKETVFHSEIKYLKDLIDELRNAVAHFDINVISENDKGLIDYIEFRDSDKNDDKVIARFRATELSSFINYYASCLLENINEYHPEHKKSK